MHNKNEICKKITEIYPDIGECGIDVKVDFDTANKAWVVDLTKGGHHLKTFLEDDEASQCVDGKQCVSLGIQIAELRRNIEMV